MGKNKKNNGKLFELEQEVKERKKEEHRIKTRNAKIKALCCHVGGDGEARLDQLNESGDYRCRICDTEFNLAVVSPEELEMSFDILHNVAHQIKLFSDKPEEELELLKNIGEIPLQAKAILDLYKTNVITSGNKKNKDRYQNHYNTSDNYNGGVYGSAALELFVPGGAKKKNKEKDKEKKKKKFY